MLLAIPRQFGFGATELVPQPIFQDMDWGVRYRLGLHADRDQPHKSRSSEGAVSTLLDIVKGELMLVSPPERSIHFPGW